MHFKKISLWLLSFFCLISLSYLGLSNRQSSSNSTTIDFFNQKPEVAESYQHLAKLYQKSHPNIKIKVTTVGNSNGASALQAKFISGDAPDLVMLGGLPEVDRYHNRLISLDNMAIQKKNHTFVKKRWSNLRQNFRHTCRSRRLRLVIQ